MPLLHGLEAFQPGFLERVELVLAQAQPQPVLQVLQERQVVLVEQASKPVEELGAAYLVPEAKACLALVAKACPGPVVQALEEGQAEEANLWLSCLVFADPLVHLITCGR